MVVYLVHMIQFLLFHKLLILQCLYSLLTLLDHYWLYLVDIQLFSIVYNTAIKDNTKNSYYIFLDDAGGLVQGSPVRLMGSTIGYIKDVKIFDNKVFISFLITEKGAQLPKRSIANVEFYGLGGSTSLEIMPQIPSKDDREIIIPTKTYRVQDYWKGSELVSNVLIDIYGGAGRAIEKGNLIENKHLFKQSDLVKLDILLNGDIVDALSTIVHKDFAYARGRVVVENLKKIIT